jgi:hypothetical protein
MAKRKSKCHDDGVFAGLALFPLNRFGFSPEFLKLRMSADPATILFLKFGAWTIFETCARAGGYPCSPDNLIH